MATQTWLTGKDDNRCSVASRSRSSASLLKTQTRVPSEDCTPWEGFTDPKGYGRVWFNGRWSLAHRASHELNIAPIPDGAVVRHRCDNPPCINPAHLFLGTQADNIDDREARGRGAKGESNGRSKLTETDVIAIRSATGSTREIARQYGVAASQISDIKNLKSWCHIAPERSH